MKLVFIFIVTAVCALSNLKYRSDLHENMQAAFYEEAERAYRDIIAYDENAPVKREEIYRLYRREYFIAPVREAIERLFETKPKTPKEYAERCLYAGEILENPPEGVIFVRAHLLAFSDAQAKAYDDIQKSGETQALDDLFLPLEDWARECMGAYTPENGFEPYFAMRAGDGVIPCAGGVLFLSEENASAALGLSPENRFTPPVRDARGVIVFEYVSG